MAFTRPDLPSIVDRVKSDIKNALGLTVILRRSTEDAFARAIAGASHVLHGHMRFISRQIFVDQAEVIYLERHASIYGIQRNAATFSVLSITGTGVDGTSVPSGTVLQRSDATEYTVDSVGTVASGTVTLSVTASTAGSGSNIDDGETLTLQSPISGMDSDFTVASTTTEGEDTETDDSLRSRVLARIQSPPSGGTVSDYEAYARSVAGVTRAWVLSGLGGFENNVGVYFVEDGEDPIIPSAAKVAEVQTAIDTNKPVTANATAIAPVENVIDIEVNISPNNQDVRDAITAELSDLFTREGQVAGTISGVNEFYDGGLSLSKIREAISIAEGEDDHVLVSPTADVTSATGEIISLGTITFGTLT